MFWRDCEVDSRHAFLVSELVVGIFHIFFLRNLFTDVFV